MPGYSIQTFGCRASAADGEAIAASLEQQAGLWPCARGAADLIVVNTCAVTAEAERNARALIRRLGRENPSARVVVTGCYAQRAPAELAGLSGVHGVVGNSHKGRVAEMALALLAQVPSRETEPCSAAGAGFVPLASLLRPAAPLPTPGVPARKSTTQPAAASALPAAAAPPHTPVRLLHSPFPLSQTPESGAAPATPARQLLPGGAHSPGRVAPGPFAGEHAGASDLPLSLASHRRTRPVLKVQDGCGNRCSFCVIPETRGPSRSVPQADVLAAARAFASHGGQELVLSGINLGRWGRELGATLSQLVRALLEETALPRLRLSSIEPMDWDADLLALFSSYGRSRPGQHPRLAPHAHLPLQSGADEVLRRMYRRYRPWHYADKLQRLRALMPAAAIGADILVGFPGETDSLFEESYRFIAAQPLTYLHLFPFSPRPGTAAAALARAHPVPPGAVRERMQALAQLGREKQQAFARSFLGRPLSAVTLADGTATTANFLPVRLRGPVRTNQLVWLRPASLRAGVLQAEVSPGARQDL